VSFPWSTRGWTSLARRIGGTLLMPVDGLGPVFVSMGIAAFPSDVSPWSNCSPPPTAACTPRNGSEWPSQDPCFALR